MMQLQTKVTIALFVALLIGAVVLIQYQLGHL